MKLSTTATPVTRIGMGSESNFAIKRTAKAFKVLSSSLYKDKVGAIVRELSTNAYDAHLMVGRGDRPFEIHLPKDLAAFFSIRDFGPGISHEGMIELYTTYFESDKTDTNLLIGGFGLGSKSPFSYTKSFTVVSHFEGMKRTYDCFIDDAGMPAIACRHSEETTEESGLEVIVPVHRVTDFKEFASRAKSNYTFYPVKPVVTSHEGFEFREQRTPLVEGPDFTITAANERHGWNESSDNAQIVMGVVAYPISITGLMGQALDDIDHNHPLYFMSQGHRFSAHQMRHLLSQTSFGTISGKRGTGVPNKDIELLTMCQLPITIHMPVGSIEVVAGREDISYEEETIDALKAKLREIYKIATMQVRAKFNDCKTLLEARKMFCTLFKDHTLTAIMGGSPEIKWKGHKINSSDMILNYDKLPQVEIFHYTDDHDGKCTQSKLPRREKPKTDRNSLYVNNHYYEEDYHYAFNTKKFDVRHANNYEFFWRDGADRNGHARIHQYRESLREQNGGKPKDVFVFQTNDPATRENIANQLDGFTIRHVSELPDAEESYRAPTRAPVQVLQIDKITLGARVQTTYYQDWRQTTINIDEGGLYVVTDHQKIFHGGKAMQVEFSDLLNAVRYCGIVDDKGIPPIYAIPKSEMPRFIEGNEKWVTAWDYLIPKLRDHLAENPRVARKVAQSRSRNLLAEKRADVVGLMKMLTDISQEISPSHEMVRFVSEFNAQVKIGVVYDYIQRAVDALGIEVETPPVVSLVDSWDGITSRYPLFKLVLSTEHGYTTDKANVRDIAHYIKAVDAFEAPSKQEAVAA